MANLFFVAVFIDSSRQMNAGIRTRVFQRLAPIALFVFKRPEHTRRMLEALARNPEFEHSPLFIFCDGARHKAEWESINAAREVVRAFSHPAKVLIEAQDNRGLANSIVHGVSDLCDKFGRVIVVEDDLIVSPVFLDYMNKALERYADEPKVMQISGHMFPVELHADTDAIFLPFTTSWGWATWQRAWAHYDKAIVSGPLGLRQRIAFDLGGVYPYYRMLKRALKHKRDSWAVKWYLSVFLSRGLVLFPKQSLVANDGFDGTGTHCGNKERANDAPLQNKPVTSFPAVVVSKKVYSRVTEFIASERGLIRRMADWALRLV